MMGESRKGDKKFARKRRGTKENPWPEETRQKIRNGGIIARLLKHVESGKENETLSPSQVRAGLGLIAKVLPDLTENKTELSGDLVVNVYADDKPTK